MIDIVLDTSRLGEYARGLGVGIVEAAEQWFKVTAGLRDGWNLRGRMHTDGVSVVLTVPEWTVERREGGAGRVA